MGDFYRKLLQREALDNGKESQMLFKTMKSSDPEPLPETMAQVTGPANRGLSGGLQKKRRRVQTRSLDEPQLFDGCRFSSQLCNCEVVWFRLKGKGLIEGMLRQTTLVDVGKLEEEKDRVSRYSRSRDEKAAQ